MNEVNERSFKISISTILIVAFLLALYTYIQIDFFGIRIPPLLPGLLAAVIFLVLAKGRFNVALFRLWLAILSIVFLSIFFAPQVFVHFGERLKGFLYFSYSTFVALIVCQELMRWENKKIEKLFLVSSFVILIGCFLENYAGLKIVSDSFREHIIVHDLYDADQRDVDNVGMVRPKFFTSEPSFVAIFLLLTMTCWMCMIASPASFFLCLAMSIAAMFLIRSPIAVFLLINTFIFYIYRTVYMSAVTKRSLFNWVVTIFLLLAVAAVLVIVQLPSFLHRVEQIIALEDVSFLIRIVAPVLVCFEVLKESPFFGAGISGYEYVEGVIIETFQELNIPMVFDVEIISSKVVNVFWAHWINLGILGGGIFLYFLVRLVRLSGIKSGWSMLIFFLVVLEFCQIMGAYNGVRFWCFLMIFLAVFSKVNLWREEDAYREQKPVN